MSGFDMKDYVPVNERVDAFYKQYPEGSICSEIVELTATRVTVKAYAYRNPTDPRPGTGHSSLDIPGSTPYTKGSEVENAETSAWGRAIAALGFDVKRGIASAEEVRNKQPQGGHPAVQPRPVRAVPTPPSETGPDGGYDEPSPFEDEVVDLATGDTIEARIKRAEALAARAAASSVQAECPEHGASRVKVNKRGLYCATKLPDGEWCPWTQKVAA